MPKAPAKHDPKTGRFESPSPLNDAALLHQAVRWVQAIVEIQPLVKGFAEEGHEDPSVRGAFVLTGHCLETIRAALLQGLEVDPVAHREAKKPVLKAARLRRLEGGAVDK